MKQFAPAPAVSHAGFITRPLRKVSEERFPLCDGICLRVPVVQAPLGICDGPHLAAAISRAGALGTLTVRTPHEHALLRRLQRMRRITSRPILLAFNAEWEREEVLECALERDFRHFQLFWWNGPRLARRIQDRNGVVFWLVGTRAQAEEALSFGADVLVAQGTSAGGQVRSPFAVEDLLAELRALTNGTVPIVAGGGLADRADVLRMRAAGAAAAYMGTRFLVTEEAAAPRWDKRRLAAAATAQLILDRRLIGFWPCAPRRRLELSNGADRPSLFAGAGLDRINRLLPAAEVIRRLSVPPQSEPRFG